MEPNFIYGGLGFVLFVVWAILEFFKPEIKNVPHKDTELD